MEQNKLSKRLRLGSYSLVLCAIVLVAVIVLNVIVSSLPTKYTSIDISPSAVTELGDVTRDYAASLTGGVMLYQIASSGSEDEVVKTLLRHYAELSPRITFKSVDPVTNPTFLSTFGAENTEENSVIVVNDEDETRFKVLPYTDLFEFYIAEFDDFFSYEDADYYYKVYSTYYQTELTITEYFKGEQMITSAIDYVVSDDLPNVYVLTGHGESALEDSTVSMLDADNLIIHNDFSLILQSSVPDDASIVIICLPTADIGTDEAAALSDFIDRGGAVLLVSSYASEIRFAEMPNLMSLAGKMGLTAKNGFLCDEDTNHFTYYNRQYYALLPTANTYGPLSLLDGAASKTFMFLSAHPIAAVPEYDGKAAVTALLATSDKGYIKLDTSSIARTEGDETGEFMMGAFSEMPEEDGGGRFVWYSSSYILADLYANRDLFICTANYLADRETSISISSKLLEETYLAPMSEGRVNAWSAVIIFVIPGFILAGGFFIWFRRRRR